MPPPRPGTSPIGPRTAGCQRRTRGRPHASPLCRLGKGRGKSGAHTCSGRLSESGWNVVATKNFCGKGATDCFSKIQNAKGCLSLPVPTWSQRGPATPQGRRSWRRQVSVFHAHNRLEEKRTAIFINYTWSKALKSPWGVGKSAAYWSAIWVWIWRRSKIRQHNFPVNEIKRRKGKQSLPHAGRRPV